MTETLCNKYWWSGYQQDTQDYVNQCKFCLRRKPSSGGIVPIQEYLGPDYPFQIFNGSHRTISRDKGW
jgi:hypothetical protein